MKLFNIAPHGKYPREYDFCINTGVCFYKKARERKYEETYFLEEYKAQYKKTYYEDETNLRSLAKKRLEILNKFCPPENKNLLEIGCAAGFFLDEAKKSGYRTKGLEISNMEVQFAKSLGLDVDCVSFLDWEPKEKFDIFCAFFVLEHFSAQELALEKIFSLLKEDGIIFLALPSFYGPTFLTNPDEWFNTHPADHFADYSPESLQKVFSNFNARIIYKSPMSFHPNRDKGWRGKFPFRPFYKILASMDCYGDTIQIMARKKKI